jgi:hypothetical protein
MVCLPKKFYNSQKYSKARKMEDRKMFVDCSLLCGEHCFDDAKRYFSVFHFSVLAFVWDHLTLPS